MNLEDLVTISKNRDEFLEFLLDFHLIPSSLKCKCGRELKKLVNVPLISKLAEFKFKKDHKSDVFPNLLLFFKNKM